MGGGGLLQFVHTSQYLLKYDKNNKYCNVKTYAHFYVNLLAHVAATYSADRITSKQKLLRQTHFMHKNSFFTIFYSFSK
jgi:hypothetical protein